MNNEGLTIYIITAIFLISIGIISGDKQIRRFLIVGALIPGGNIIILGLIIGFGLIGLIGYLLEKIGI